jgi:hypothetical protein
MEVILISALHFERLMSDIPVLRYIWTLLRPVEPVALKQNIHWYLCKHRCLRYILRIWWPNIISNKDQWKVTEQEDINVEIRKRKFRWIGHTLRKEDGEIPKAALHWNPQGNRKRGRPRNSWRRSVIKEAGRSWNELRLLAADRQKWKGLIDNLCS